MIFGEFIKKTRLENGYSLRKFCELLELDPSNWSKVERDRMPAPTNREKLDRIAKLLNLKVGSNEWHEFYDLASLSSKTIPQEIYDDEEILEALPLFFRTARGDKPTEEELNKLIDMLKRR
jgi:transcriptional regulator with XRE-family HTH domain